MPDTTVTRLFHDRESRILAKPELEAADVPPDADGVPSGGLLPPPGSIVVYVGRTASPAWQTVRSRIRQRDWEGLAATPLRRRSPGAPVRTAQPDDMDVYFDVRHAGRTIMRDAALIDELAYGTLTFPYTGGEVDDADFEIVEYLRTADAEHTLSYYMLRRAPELTALESELLGKVPPELREIHVGPRLPCDNTTTMEEVAADVAREAQAAVDRQHRAARGGGGFADPGTMRLVDASVEEIAGRAGSPAASAGELLALRRRLLGR